MSVRSRPGSSIPELTVQVARASNPQGTTAMCTRDQLDGLWSDEDFTEWYPRCAGSCQLAVDTAETGALAQVAVGCSSVPAKVTPAR